MEAYVDDSVGVAFELGPQLAVGNAPDSAYAAPSRCGEKFFIWRKTSA